jgi:hydrogenase 3 maturation protease
MTDMDQLPVTNHWSILAGNWQRIAILGVGNELNGDDAAGVLVARMLKSLIKDRGPRTEKREAHLEENLAARRDPCYFGVRSAPPELLILETGPAPENFTGPVRRFHPDLVLFVDAADIGEVPGSVAWLDWTECEGLSASTHTLPPSVLAEFLIHELGCRMVLVGIQPLHLEFDRAVSEVVMQAVNRTSREMAAWLASVRRDP